MYQALLDTLVTGVALPEGDKSRNGQILAAITGLKQICNHPAAYQDDDQPLAGRSGKLAAARGDRRRGVRGRREGARVHALRASGASSSPSISPNAPEPRRSVTTAACRARCAIASSTTSRPRPARACSCSRSRPAAPGSTSPLRATSCSTTGGGTPRSRTRHATARGASVRPAPLSRTGSCARAPSTSASRRSSTASGASPTSVLPKSSSLADLDTDQLRVALGIRTDAVLTEDLEEATV